MLPVPADTLATPVPFYGKGLGGPSYFVLASLMSFLRYCVFLWQFLLAYVTMALFIRGIYEFSWGGLGGWIRHGFGFGFFS